MRCRPLTSQNLVSTCTEMSHERQVPVTVDPLETYRDLMHDRCGQPK